LKIFIIHHSMMRKKNPPQHLFHVARNILNLQMKRNIRVKRVQHRNIQIKHLQ